MNNVAHTKFGNSRYSDLFYVDKLNKVVITFSPRAGCTISLTEFLKLTGLFEKAQKYSNWLHDFRWNVLNNVQQLPVENLKNQNYTFIKTCVNPYRRAISSFLIASLNITFRTFMTKLVTNNYQYFNDSDIYHFQCQYIKGEENIITSYIHLDRNETVTIKLHNGEDYVVNPNKYTSAHHHKKINSEEFCGDIPKNTVKSQLPQSYKYFYDDEIKKMVEQFYGKDIEYYGYSFDEL